MQRVRSEERNSQLINNCHIKSKLTLLCLMLILHFPELGKTSFRERRTFTLFLLSSVFYICRIFFEKTIPALAQHGLHPGQRIGRNDPVLKWRVIPAKCHGWSRNSYGAAEFISPESITGEVATEILSLEAE